MIIYRNLVVKLTAYSRRFYDHVSHHLISTQISPQMYRRFNDSLLTTNLFRRKTYDAFTSNGWLRWAIIDEFNFIVNPLLSSIYVGLPIYTSVVNRLYPCSEMNENLAYPWSNRAMLKFWYELFIFFFE